MNNLRNKVQLIGFMGKNAEVRRLNNGKTVASISLATSESYKNASGKKITRTQWHTLIAWGKTAELIERYTQKGAELVVQGRLTNRIYEDKDGMKRHITEILVTEVLFLGMRKSRKEMLPDAE